MLLQDKTAIVTGAGSGMGRAVTKRFAEEGATVVALDRDAQAAQAAISEISGPHSSDSFAFEVDVSSAESVEAGFAEIDSRTAGPDILVNCAGIREIIPPLELPVDEWDRVVGVNLRGTFLCCQAAAKRMVAAGNGGSLVNISSTAGIRGYENRPAYSASKAGVIGLTMSLARDLGPAGVRVNCISPGLTRTPFTEVYFQSEQLVRDIPRVVPLGKAATPDMLARAILFLASDLAEYVSGVNLPVDGGHTIVATFNLGGDSDNPFSANRTLADAEAEK
jgi:3-oxoacyl-[acyl-carrier protein] reductase